MKPRIRMGLIVGAAGLFLNICISGLMGICGPFVSLLAGGVAGYLASQQEKTANKSEGGKVGAISGSISGALVSIGQLIGGVIALSFIQMSGIQSPIGQVPSVDSAPVEIATYYLSGLGTGVCFGLIGIVFAAGAGAAAGYLSAKEQPLPPQE